MSDYLTLGTYKKRSSPTGLLSGKFFGGRRAFPERGRYGIVREDDEKEYQERSSPAGLSSDQTPPLFAGVCLSGDEKTLEEDLVKAI